eukprot:1098134-Rhodomonas_salina.1
MPWAGDNHERSALYRVGALRSTHWDGLRRRKSEGRVWQSCLRASVLGRSAQNGESEGGRCCWGSTSSSTFVLPVGQRWARWVTSRGRTAFLPGMLAPYGQIPEYPVQKWAAAIMLVTRLDGDEQWQGRAQVPCWVPGYGEVSSWPGN